MAEMTGAMTLAPLSQSLGRTAEDALALRAVLREDHNIELQVVPWNDRLWTRVAAQVYNDMADFEYLSAALTSIVKSNSRQGAN